MNKGLFVLLSLIYLSSFINASFPILTEELQQISEIKEGPLSLTVDQRLQKYEKEIGMCDQIREQHQQQKKDIYQNFDQVWETIQKMKGTYLECFLRVFFSLMIFLHFVIFIEQSQGQKTREELLAEQRDYKRRRKSYRAKNIKITQRTPTQVKYYLMYLLNP